MKKSRTRRERRLQRSRILAEDDGRRCGMPRAGLPARSRASACSNLARRLAVRRPDRAAVPGQARRVVIGVKEQAGGFEIGRRPQPEELRRDCRRQRRCGSRAPTGRTPQERSRVPIQPSTVSRSPSTSIQPLIRAVLRQARVVHERARAVAADEARLLDGERAARRRRYRRRCRVRRVDASRAASAAARSPRCGSGRR